MLRFIERIAKLHNADDIIFMYALYISELSLFHCEFASLKPSLLASAAIMIAFRTMRNSSKWNASMEKNTGYSEKKVKETAMRLCRLLAPIACQSRFDDEKLKSLPLVEEQKCVKRKYCHPKNYEVAMIEMKMITL